jgi:hypothetical protein
VKITRFLFVTLAVMLVYPCLVLAYGGGEGTTQSGIGSGLDSGKICQCETLEQVRKGERWNTRPEAMKKSPYEAAGSFWDAEQSLLTGYKHGSYTKEEMIEIFKWLKTNKFFISDVAMEEFNKLTEATGTKSLPQTKTTTSTKKPQTLFDKYPATPKWDAVLIRAKEMYLNHPNRSRVAIAHNLTKEIHTPEEYAKLSLIKIAYEVDYLEDFLKRAEKDKLLPPRKERDLSKLKKNK